MGDFLKKNVVALIIVIATVGLAGIAMFTALRLYQLRNQAVAPNVPSSKPAAAEPSATPAANICTLTFALAAATATPSPTVTASPSPTPTPTPVPQCGTTCTTNSDCPTSMVCSGGQCRNPQCTTSTNCICATATPTPAPTSTPIITVASPTATPTLPVAGVETPTIIGIAVGILLIVGAFVLAI